MLAKIQFTITPLYPKMTLFNQALIFTSKIKVKITDDNLPNINANNETNIKDIFLLKSHFSHSQTTTPV